ncbi:hypothetical protein MKX01_037841 [Papaver californicum]|nr:hypothetical protein MKX01_037841 [Papaver californicum]
MWREACIQKAKEKELLERIKSHKKKRRSSESGSDTDDEHKNTKHHKDKGQPEMGEESHRKKRGRSESDIETDDEYNGSHRKSRKALLIMSLQEPPVLLSFFVAW